MSLIKVFGTYITTAVAAYLLRTDFSGVSGQPVTLTNGQVLDTEAEGIQDGSLTVVDVEGGKFTVSGDVIAVIPQTTPVWDDAAIYSDLVTKDNGLIFYGKFKCKTGVNLERSIFAISDTVAQDGSPKFIFNTSGLSTFDLSIFNPENSLVWLGDSFLALNMVVELIFVLDTLNDQLFAYTKRDIDPGFTLQSIFGYTLPAQLLWLFSHHSWTGDIELVKIPETLYPELVTPTLTLSTSMQAAFADVLLSGVFTTPGSGTTPLEIKYRQSDADNYHLVKITPGTAGTDLSLHTVEASSEQAALATADVDFATSTAYSILVIADGADYYKVYINGVEKLTYTSAESFNLTETGVSQVEASFTSIDIGAYARSGYTIDV